MRDGEKESSHQRKGNDVNDDGDNDNDDVNGDNDGSNSDDEDDDGRPRIEKKPVFLL